MRSQCNFEGILDAIYESVLDTDTLKTALELSAAYLGATGANYHVFSKTTLESLFYVSFGESYTDEAIAAYLDRWQYANPHRDAMRQAHAENPYSAFLCHEHISEDDKRNSAYFRDFFSKRGLSWIAGGIVWDDASTETTIGFARPNGAPPFDEQSRIFLERILPHARRAMRLAWKFGRPESGTMSIMNGAIAAAPTPTFLVDMNCSVRWKNGAATELADAHPGALIHGGRLRLGDKKQKQALLALVEHTADEHFAGASSGALRVDIGDEGFEVEVMPATIPAGALVGVLPHALVMIRPVGLRSLSGNILQEQFELTDAESRLAVALAQGASIDEIANSNQTSRHTVRTQLRSIYAKTGVNRQSALTALVWKSA